MVYGIASRVFAPGNTVRVCVGLRLKIMLWHRGVQGSPWSSICPDGGTGIRVGLRNQILGVRFPLGVRKSGTFSSAAERHPHTMLRGGSSPPGCTGRRKTCGTTDGRAKEVGSSPRCGQPRNEDGHFRPTSQLHRSQWSNGKTTVSKAVNRGPTPRWGAQHNSMPL